MNIHEYQAKDLLAEFGVPIPAGKSASKVEEFDAAISLLPPNSKVVVKSQIHAGGRGKGTFTDGYKGGVKVVDGAEAALEAGKAMLGNTLVTKQTGPAGKQVNTVYFTEASEIAHEYYLAILLDRATSRVVIIASTEGGVDIEEVAEKTPEKITRVLVDPALGIQPWHCRAVAFGLGFSGDTFKQMTKVVANLYRLFWEKDCAMVEINPLIKTPAGDILALDAKIGFDDNALFRHPEIMELRDTSEEDPKELAASAAGLSYIALDGNIACLVNGAGLAMATMDIIKHFGGNPANFLDVGGGANADQVTEAFKIILSDPNVKGILVNIFGGIMSCKTIADGIVAAAKNVDITVPLVVRLEGNQVAEGKQVLKDSGLALIPADSLSDAAQKIVAEVGKA
ncbi:MAG: ADP-forming succinate--CoA ligase subunit beta [Verrucomicrobiota bacterium]